MNKEVRKQRVQVYKDILKHLCLMQDQTPTISNMNRAASDLVGFLRLKNRLKSDIDYFCKN